jgi:hypothetical protein
MAYSNYVNSTSASSGANSAASPTAYVNYANANLTTTPYGWWITGTNIPSTYTIAARPSYTNYTNYNNWYRSAPDAYTITSVTAASFASGVAIDDTPMNNLQTEITKLSTTKVQSTGAPIATTPTTVSATAGTSALKDVINNMIANVTSLWSTIKGGAVVGSIPTTKSSGDPMYAADMQNLVNRVQDLANTVQVRGFAASGYLNCANWTTNPMGTQNPAAGNAGFAAAGTQTAGSDTYPALGTEPATNR